jgi:O-antigen/teichoic acid export membrane protein
LLGNVIGKGLALVAGIIVARFLGRDIYGEYGMIRNTLLSISLFSTFGLGYTATKFIAEYRNSNPDLLLPILRYAEKTTLVVSGILAILLFLFSEYVSVYILKAPHLSTPLKIVAAWIIFNALTTTQIGVLAGFGEFKKLAKINANVGIITFILSFGLTWFWQLNGALVALLTAQIINWYLNFKLVRKSIPVNQNKEKNKQFAREIISFSFPVALQEAIYSIIYWSLSYLLIKFSTYGELGLYSAAMQWNALILFIPGILRNVILSHLSEATNNIKKHNKVLFLTLIINFLSTLIPFLGVLLLINFITPFYGSSFEGLGIVLKLATFSTVFLSLSNVYAQAYLSKGKNWLMLGFRSLRDLGTLGIAFYYLNEYKGVKGAYYLTMSALLMSVVFLVTMAVFYHLKLNSTIKSDYEFIEA